MIFSLEACNLFNQAAKLKFDNTKANKRITQPTFLLLSQNISGLCGEYEDTLKRNDTQVKTNHNFDKKEYEKCSPALASDSLNVTNRVAPEKINSPFVEENLLSLEEQQMIVEFVADLRRWIHRISYFSWKSELHKSNEFTANNIRTTQTFKSFSSLSSPKVEEQQSNFVKACESYSCTESVPLIDVIVIHFQEIGGKQYNNAFNLFFAQHIQEHLLPEAAGWRSQLLMNCIDVKNNNNTDINSNIFPKGSVNEINELFTALGSIIFLSPRMCNISSMLSIPHRTYIPVIDDPCSYGGRLENVFHGHKFSHAYRSRKGFLLTSMRFGTTLVHFCNLHLFHDIDNAVAFSSSPSRYAEERVNAMIEAVAECLSIISANEPLFFFGDFNCRLDGFSFTQYMNYERRMALHPERNELRCPDMMWKLWDDVNFQNEMRAKFDRELGFMLNRVAMESQMELAELPCIFGPTYCRVPHVLPLIDDMVCKSIYGNAAGTADDKLASPLLSPRVRALQHGRLPAWCDRVVFNVAALELISSGNGHIPWEATPQYTYCRDGHALTIDNAISACKGKIESDSYVYGNEMCKSINTFMQEHSTASTSALSKPIRSEADEAATLLNSRIKQTVGLQTKPTALPNVPLSSLDNALPIDQIMQNKTYLYDSVSFVHTDHDGVFLLFENIYDSDANGNNDNF